MTDQYTGQDRRDTSHCPYQHHNTPCEPLQGLIAARRIHDDELLRLSTDLHALRTDVSANTTLTAEALEILVAAKGAFRFFAGLGNFLKWITAIVVPIVALYYAIKGGGKP